MNSLKKLNLTLILICFTLVMGCGNNDNKSKEAAEASAPPIEKRSDSQGKDHTYDITINPGNANERRIKGQIENISKDDVSSSNFSVYSNTTNGKAIVLRIGNDDLLIHGLFFLNENGTIADLFDGSEDESEEKSNLMISIKPPSTEGHNSMSGRVQLSNIEYAMANDQGGAIGYTLVFDGQFEDYEDNISQIKGQVKVEIPNYKK